MASSRHGALLATTALCAVAFTPLAGGAIFKCQDAQGKVTYQQKPCEGVAKDTTATVNTPLTSTVRGDPAVLAFLVEKYQCDRGHPEIARQTKANYDRWRERNAQEVAKVEASAEYRTMLDDVQKNKNPPVTSAMLDKICKSVVQHLDQESRTGDPRRQTTAR